MRGNTSSASDFERGVVTGVLVILGVGALVRVGSWAGSFETVGEFNSWLHEPLIAPLELLPVVLLVVLVWCVATIVRY